MTQSSIIIWCEACEGTGYFVSPEMLTDVSHPFNGGPAPECSECNGNGFFEPSDLLNEDEAK